MKASTHRQPASLDGLDTWVNAHNPDPSLSYSKGWWECIEFIRFLRDQHGLEAIDIPATYEMKTPPPCETLLMPVYRIRHSSLECYIKTDFEILPPNWFLSVTASQPLAQTYGLFDPARDWRREPRYLDGLQEEWCYPSFAESPMRFTCAVDTEMDVYMLLRLLIGAPDPSRRDPLLRR